MLATYTHTGYNTCVIHNVYGWWMLEKDCTWRRVWGPMHSAEPTDAFKQELKPIRALELLVYGGLSERKASLIGIPSSGTNYRGT